MFASTLDRAANSASITKSSRNHKTSGKRNEGAVTDKKISQTIADICGIQHALYMWICLAQMHTSRRKVLQSRERASVLGEVPQAQKLASATLIGLQVAGHL